MGVTRLVVAGTAALLVLPLSLQAVARDPGLTAQTLTPSPERYVVRTGAGGDVTIRAKAPRDGLPHDWNRREILVRPGVRPTSDHGVCATWTDQSRDLDQQGLAVRFRTGPGDRKRAVTLTKNTYAGYVWVFNLLTWDTRRPGDPWRALGQFDLSSVVTAHGRVRPFPWRVCLRAVGHRVDFKVWRPEREPEPSWTDPEHARSATTPGRFSRPGVPGWYVGHLFPGDHVTYADLRTDPARAG